MVDATRRSWTVGTFGLRRSTQPVASLIKSICAAVVLAMIDDPKIVHQVDIMTQGANANGLSAMQRTLDLAKTVDAEYFDHPDDPLITVYLRPANDNEDDNETLNALIRVKTLAYGMVAFNPKSLQGERSECVICKSDTHLAYCCPFPHGTHGVGGDHGWWGPPDQMSKLVEGMFAVASTIAGIGRGLFRGRGAATGGANPGYRGRGARRSGSCARGY
jgi:hypothetical protein